MIGVFIFRFFLIFLVVLQLFIFGICRFISMMLYICFLVILMVVLLFFVNFMIVLLFFRVKELSFWLSLLFFVSNICMLESFRVELVFMFVVLGFLGDCMIGKGRQQENVVFLFSWFFILMQLLCSFISIFIMLRLSLVFLKSIFLGCCVCLNWLKICFWFFFEIFMLVLDILKYRLVCFLFWFLILIFIVIDFLFVNLMVLEMRLIRI